MKLYKMPDGTTRQFAEGKVPACAVPLIPEKAAKPEAKPEVKPEPEVKAVEPENKAVKPANKATKGSKKK